MIMDKIIHIIVDIVEEIVTFVPFFVIIAGAFLSSKQAKNVNANLKKVVNNPTKDNWKNFYQMIIKSADEKVVHDTPKPKEKSVTMMDGDYQKVDDEYFGTVDTSYEDEESYETELVTPMSQIADDGEIYTQTDWQQLSNRITPTKHQEKRKKSQLKQAIIFSEILAKPKGWE